MPLSSLFDVQCEPLKIILYPFLVPTIPHGIPIFGTWAITRTLKLVIMTSE